MVKLKMSVTHMFIDKDHQSQNLGKGLGGGGEMSLGVLETTLWVRFLEGTVYDK